MKILIATSHRHIVGGIETYLQVLIPALLKRGHRVAMLYDHSTGNGATVDPIEAELPLWSSGALDQQPELWREVMAWKPDAVYSHGLLSLDTDRILHENYPVAMFAHGYWGTCATGQKCHTFPSVQPCQRTFGPMCLLLHYPRRCGGLNPKVAWKLFQFEKARNARLVEHRAVLVASKHMQTELQKHGVDTGKLHLVRLPLTVPGMPTAPLRRVPRGRLLFVGRLTALKGADFLIRAIPEAQRKLGCELTLTVAGDGRDLDAARSLARRTGIAAEFLGWVNTSQKLALMRASDLLVVPSLWPEPFGMVGIEAGSNGLPAAGFAVGGIADWLVPGQSGELAPGDPPTVQGLGDAIVRALRDPDHYYNLCQGAWQLSRQFSLESHIAHLEAILSDCAQPVEALAGVAGNGDGLA